MAGMWPYVRRFGSNARKFAEESPKMDDILCFGLVATVVWSILKMERKHDAAAAARARAAAVLDDKINRSA